MPPGRERSSEIMDVDGSAIRLALINVRSLKNKSFILNKFVRARDLDLNFIMETWMNTERLYLIIF